MSAIKVRSIVLLPVAAALAFALAAHAEEGMWTFDNFPRDEVKKRYGFAPDDGMPRDFNPETLKLSRGFVTLGARPGVPLRRHP